jgi:RNA polymerase subunit RPABC4/transcription elongation factor Spt4
MEALIARSIQVLIALGGAYVLTLWFAIVVWTFQDIQARSRSVVAQIFSTLVVLIFSIPGLLIYLILRPRYTLDDAFQRSLEEEYLMQDLEELPLCPNCQQYVEDDWVFCPNCRIELRDNCIACDQLIDLRWEICPFCGTEQYEDDIAITEPQPQPILAPSPQFLGRPQLTQTQVQQIAGRDEEKTRPIIPATVRVDLRSGDVATEQVPALPLGSRRGSFSTFGEPRRVPIDGNGYHPPEAASEVQPSNVDNEPHEDATDSDEDDPVPSGVTDVSDGASAESDLEKSATVDQSPSDTQPNDSSTASANMGSDDGPTTEQTDEGGAPKKRSRKRRSRSKKPRSNSTDSNANQARKG